MLDEPPASSNSPIEMSFREIDRLVGARRSQPGIAAGRGRTEVARGSMLPRSTPEREEA
jgi:hypothetical protein